MKLFYSTRSRYPAMIFPMIWYHSYLDSKRIFQDFGIKFDKAGLYILNGKRNNFFCSVEQVHEFQEICLNKIIGENDFMKNFELKLASDGEKLEAFVANNLLINFSAISNEKLFDLYNEYNQIFTELNYPVLVVTLLCADPLSDYISKIITEQKDLEVIAKSKQLPYLLEYEKEILEASIDDASKLKDKWFWVPYDYAGPEEWGFDHFQNELSKPKNPNRLQKLNKYTEETQLEQSRILEKYHIQDKFMVAIRGLRSMSFLQDERKRITNKSYPFLQKCLLHEISKRTNVPIEHLWLMVPSEIQDALAGVKKDVSNRVKSCAVEIHEGVFTVHEQLPVFLSEEDEKQGDGIIKGVCASQGIVRGIVKVCLTSQDVKKMEKGDILVSPATSPDYILGFRLAGAVLTDEGGLTSHAAVVSREMGIPCVVGTKNATSLLKDGDVVEVDASKGIIKKLTELTNF